MKLIAQSIQKKNTPFCQIWKRCVKRNRKKIRRHKTRMQKNFEKFEKISISFVWSTFHFENWRRNFNRAAQSIRNRFVWSFVDSLNNLNSFIRFRCSSCKRKKTHCCRWIVSKICYSKEIKRTSQKKDINDWIQNEFGFLRVFPVNIIQNKNVFEENYSKISENCQIFADVSKTFGNELQEFSQMKKNCLAVQNSK